MSKLLVAWHHFKTITTHRILVMQGCFKMGLYWQGLTHDLSKYSPTEFKRRKRRDIPPTGCIIRAETVIIMNIGRM